MGSVPASDVTLTNVTDVPGPDNVPPKIEPDQDGFDSPSASSIDLDDEAEALPEKSLTDPPPVPKRKGGRKPVQLVLFVMRSR